jgi:hypothetical protein
MDELDTPSRSSSSVHALLHAVPDPICFLIVCLVHCSSEQVALVIGILKPLGINNLLAALCLGVPTLCQLEDDTGENLWGWQLPQGLTRLTQQLPQKDLLELDRYLIAL